ncbi:laccase [Thozetella sp. PMI_491]|nr:laccase [Thozetella sp. PMI_491]
MKQSLLSFLTLAVGIIPFTSAHPTIESDFLTSVEARQAPVPGCQNGPTSRNCWGNYNIDTNYYEVFPNTGKTVEVWLSVEQIPCAPDGYNRTCMTFNGTVPGPAIGTAIHWHGIRQLNSFSQDGIPGVTQCPIGPKQNGALHGETMTYTFKVTQYGSTWYHSHQTLQYAEGLFGPLILNGPATANYDVDAGMIFLNDWSHVSAFTLWNNTSNGFSPQEGIPPTLDNTLINGLNTFNCAGSTDANCIGGGKKFSTVFDAGKKYRIRLVNAAVDAQFHFSIDGHKLTVIGTDLVPTVPYQTDSIKVSIGQRYDVIVEANAKPADYWLRANWVSACNTNAKITNTTTTGIVRYNRASTSDPTSVSIVVAPTVCDDEDPTNLVPHLKLNVGNIVSTSDESLSSSGILTTAFHWVLGASNLAINWEDPTLGHILSGNLTFDADYNVVSIDKAASTNNVDQFALLVIEDNSGFGITHPIHLHGHDFWVVSQSFDAYDSSKLNLTNTVRRDVAMLPGGGHLALAFKLDNPGAWLVHCHIAWHASQGLAMEFLETVKSIVVSPTDQLAYNQTCTKWIDNYMWTTWPRDDSGI